MPSRRQCYIFTHKMMFSAVFLSESDSCLLGNFLICDGVRLYMDDKFSLTGYKTNALKRFYYYLQHF